MAPKQLVPQKIITNLEKKLQEMGLKNYKLQLSEGTIKGDNYLGIIAKALVKGFKENGEEISMNWIIKCAPTAPAFRQLTNVKVVFTREVYVYETVFPEFLKFQQKKNLTKPYKNFIPVYYTCLEEFNECLVMEDMKEIGFKMKDRRAPFDLEHVLLVMREYGRLHALSFALREQEPTVFKELSKNLEETFFANVDRGNFKLVFDSNFDRAIASLDEEKDCKVVKKLKRMKERFFDLLDAVIKPEAAGEYSVIGHGDCWVNNMLFKYEVGCIIFYR